MVSIRLATIIFIVSIILSLGGSSTSQCPESKGIMKRVGNTRYFIFHNPRGTTDKNYDWAGAKKMCSKLKGFKMATIEKQTTFAEVGRALEQLVTKYSFSDTWYWLDAKYNKEEQMYYWGGDISRPVRFSNFLYRYPRPTGLAGFVDRYKTYQINKDNEQCLSLALPFPAAYNVKAAKASGGVIYGFSASFDEKPCSAKMKMHAICESTLPECTNKNNDPFTLTEDKDSYFEDGNWRLGNRYFVNWKQVTKQDSEEYCRNQGLELFNPASKEAGLIPHLKIWSRGMTFSQFWTNWTYNIKRPGNGMTGVFLDAAGTKLAQIRAFVNVSIIEDFDELGRSDKFDKSLCVAMQVSSEFKKAQQLCPTGYETACNWNFIQYVPANCKNFHGTICQFSETAVLTNGQRPIEPGAIWKKSWTKNPVEMLNDTMIMFNSFAYFQNNNTYRSGIKQTFGSLICPKGYRMIRTTDKKWHTDRYSFDGEYKEHLESFWVVDEEGFNKDLNSKCSLSVPADDDGYVRKIEMVPCTDWHFYLCDKILRPVEERKYNLNYEIVNSASWDNKRFERKYPIL